MQTLHNCASKASCNLGGCAPKETLSCLQRQTLLCPSASHRTHETDARAHEGQDARRLSSARAETITQQSGRSRCDTLTAACSVERGGERRAARAIFKAAIRVIGKVGTDGASFYAQADMEGWKKKTRWIFEKRRCDKGDGLSAIKHLACKRGSAGFYSPWCHFNPAASCLLRRTVGCVQTTKRLSLSTPECHTWLMIESINAATTVTQHRYCFPALLKRPVSKIFLSQ